jgi:hypothetical protein
MPGIPSSISPGKSCPLHIVTGPSSVSQFEDWYKTLILFLCKAAILHRLGWSRNRLRRWLYFLIIAVQPFLALIFNVKAGPQRL